MNLETPEIDPLDTEANKLLFARVRKLVAGIPRGARHMVAVIVSPEDGVKLVPRGDLCNRLRAAGLDREATTARHLARRDNDAILVWGECEGEAGLAVLKLPKWGRR